MKKILIVVVAAFGVLCSSAQDNLTQIATNLPQTMGINPSIRPNRGFVSMPLLGSINIGMALPFSIDNVITKQNGQNVMTLSKWAEMSLKNGNKFNVSLDIDLLNLGFYVSDYDFITLSASYKTCSYSTMPLGAVEFLSSGVMFGDRTYDINMNFEAMGWAEFAAGYSRSIGLFTVGAKFKYLNGLAGANTGGGSAGYVLQQHYDSYTISSDFDLNIAGMPLTEGSSIMDGLFSNHGFGVDLGVSYLSEDERILATVSVSDIGKIWWSEKSATRVVSTANDEPFVFSGFGNLLDSENLSLNSVLDSIAAVFTDAVDFEYKDGAAFTSSLPLTIHAMGRYALGDELQHHLSFSFIGVKPSHLDMFYDLSVGYSYNTPNKVWQLMCNGTYTSQNVWKLGVGAVMTTGNFQLYLSTSNIVGPFRLMDTRDLGLRLGINFFFGSTRYSR